MPAQRPHLRPGTPRTQRPGTDCRRPRTLPVTWATSSPEPNWGLSSDGSRRSGRGQGPPTALWAAAESKRPPDRPHGGAAAAPPLGCDAPRPRCLPGNPRHGWLRPPAPRSLSLVRGPAQQSAPPQALCAAVWAGHGAAKGVSLLPDWTRPRPAVRRVRGSPGQGPWASGTSEWLSAPAPTPPPPVARPTPGLVTPATPGLRGSGSQAGRAPGGAAAPQCRAASWGLGQPKSSSRPHPLRHRHLALPGLLRPPSHTPGYLPLQVPLPCQSRCPHRVSQASSGQ